jgi:hypothetical protein
MGLCGSEAAGPAVDIGGGAPWIRMGAGFFEIEHTTSNDHQFAVRRVG